MLTTPAGEKAIKEKLENNTINSIERVVLAEEEMLLKMDTVKVTGVALKTRPKLLSTKLLMTKLKDKPNPPKMVRVSPRMPLKLPLILPSLPLKVSTREAETSMMPLLMLRKRSKKTNKP
jgi:hypothetical protein